MATVQKLEQELSDISERVRALNPDLAAAEAIAGILEKIGPISSELDGLIGEANENLETAGQEMEEIKQLLQENTNRVEHGKALTAKLAEIKQVLDGILAAVSAQTPALAAAIAETPAE